MLLLIFHARNITVLCTFYFHFCILSINILVLCTFKFLDYLLFSIITVFDTKYIIFKVSANADIRCIFEEESCCRAA